LGRASFPFLIQVKIMARRLLGLVVVVGVLALAGCSGNRKVTVSGTVTHKGQPVSSGILKFIGPEGAYSAASIQPDGKYIITDVVPGEVKVGVMEGPQGSGSSSGAASPGKAPAVPLPAKAADPETSGIKYTITPSTTRLDIEIP
jgi:hypothetical protein